MKIFSPILKGTTTVAQGTTNLSGSFTGSLLGTAATASYADNFTVGGTLTAQTINVQIITSSIEFVTGSTRNGSSTANTHQFTGSVLMTGSLSVTGSAAFSSDVILQYSKSIAFNSISNQYITADASGLYLGTANLARLIISSSGNVGIGTTSPFGSSAERTIHLSDAGGGFATIYVTNTANTVKTILGMQSSNALGVVGMQSNNPFAIVTNDTERMRITSAGNVGIGTTSPINKFAVISSNTAGYYNRTEPLAVFQGILPTVLIAHDGNSTGDYAELRLGNNQSIYYTYSPYVRGVQGAGINEYQLHFGTSNFSAATTKMIISQNGSIGAPSGTNIYNASDIRLKQNISTITYGLDTISSLNPVKFNWKDGFEPSEDGKDLLGFVAQEVQTIIPEAVESFGGNSVIIGDTTIENTLRVNEKFIIPVLVKAIQELSAKNTSLEERLTALENN